MVYRWLRKWRLGQVFIESQRLRKVLFIESQRLRKILFIDIQGFGLIKEHVVVGIKWRVTANSSLLTICLAGILFAGCPAKSKITLRPPPGPCLPRCKKNNSCDALDAQLVNARRPLLLCVGDQAKRGKLDRAHRCYRALRLIESARWWLRTLTSDTGILPALYRGPVETMRQEFICRVEKLSRARSAAEVEQLYLDIVRAYP